MEYQDYYKTLGVAKTATEKEIKAAYRKLARQHHPDLNAGDPKAESRFKEVNEAYEVLSDREKRRRYDQLGANWKQYERASPGGPGRWPDAQGPGVRVEFGEDLGGFSDFFKTFFGGGGPGFGRSADFDDVFAGARVGSDLESTIEVSLEEVLSGTTRHLRLGTGKGAREVEVRVPPGVREGSRLRVAGEGEVGRRGGPKGDLYLKVSLRPHAVFERRGDDLVTAVRVPVTTAVLGGEMKVPTLDGSLEVKVPAGTNVGQTFRLRGQGLPVLGKGGERGDVLATLQVEVPKKLSARQRDLYEELKKVGS